MTTTPETNPVSADEPTDESTSRRNAIRALVVGGGAAAGVVAFGKSASAGDGDPIIIGAAATDNDAQSATTLEYDGPEILSGASVFSVSDGPIDGNFPYPAKVGGYGGALVANGVHGSTTNVDGFGVVAASLAAAEDDAEAPAGLAVASANGPQMLFVALDGAVAGPTGGVHVAGELYRDAEGTLWFTVPDGDDVRFVELAATQASGSFHAINPQRAYDSRQAGFSPDGGTMLAPNTNRVISVATGYDGSGANVVLADAVPPGATAVQINLTVANPTAENFLAVTDGDTTSTQTSVLNWGVGELQIANSITIPVNDAREIRVYCGDQTGSTHFIVDVFGYYR
jgi:hypothetical protein